MPVFYAKQEDYIAKLNYVAALFNQVNVNATVGGTTTLDFSQGGSFFVTMGSGDTTIALSNLPTGPIIMADVWLKKDNSTAIRTITWPASVYWGSPSGSTAAPNIFTTAAGGVTTANNIALVQLRSTNGGSSFRGTLVGVGWGA